MGPKKETKKDVQKREKGADDRKWSVEDDINSDTWRCAVILAVEKTYYDRFVLEEFLEESYNGRRQEVSVIDFDTCVMKILKDFAKGELPYKYTFLLNFSSVFQEAVEYIDKKMDVPLFVLVKVTKALLFYLREENLMLIKKKATGPPDPIKAMAERPANFDSDSTRKKDLTKKGDNGLKVRPPSVTKEDTKLLKRGERARDDHCIDDAPRNAYFNLYVLLKGFYNPELPLEMIKANIPLHGVLCIDTSRSGVRREAISEQNTLEKQEVENKLDEIQNFWDVFLKAIWDPRINFYFKDTVFQVYLPQRLLCEKKKLREFIYREISYLMYDLSDLKRQMNDYLENIHLWDVADKRLETSAGLAWPENLPEDCVSVPMVLQCVVDAICEEDWKDPRSGSCGSARSAETEWASLRKYYFPNKYATPRYCAEGVGWSQELEESGDANLLNIYYKSKELDAKYDLDEKSLPSDNSEKEFVETENTQTAGNFQSQTGIENVEETFLSSDGVFRSYWNCYNKEVQTIFAIDHCLYALLMTKIACPYDAKPETFPLDSYHSIMKNSNFELIENLSNEMRKPHFTITEGSRSILKAVPYNVKNPSRDFFRPDQFKVVSPEKLKASSAPEFRVTPSIKIQALCKSEMFPVEMLKNPFENLRTFINECLLLNAKDFDFLEFLSKPKLLDREEYHWSSYNCIDHSYSVLNDCIFLRLHNRKDCQNVHHETFHQTLRTLVGLRDFYDYVLEDEAEWLAYKEELYQANAFLSNTVIVRDSFKDFTDADFWMPSSLKLQAIDRYVGYARKFDEIKTEPSSGEKMQRGKIALQEEMYETPELEGYNVSDMAVQFSGLKTIYYVNDCSVTVQLIERLYGNQDLGIHVREACHTLHLHSYVCPEPHIIDPFTFHVVHKNGVIMAFGRHLIETFEEIEEKIESTSTVKSRKYSAEPSARIIKRQIPKSVKDEDFVYDMAASVPNGLLVRTVRRIVKPCYIKQNYVADIGEGAAGLENSRLFLPNGNVVKMMKNGTVEILKVDASIIMANLNDLTSGMEGEGVHFARYEVVSGEGQIYAVEHGRMVSSRRVQVFQNTDMSTNQVFFRRKDGTDYMLQNDGTLCVQFKDGTKLSSSLLLGDDPSGNGKARSGGENPEETDPDVDFVFVFTEITAEHPDYATVIHDGRSQKWRILLPQESTVTVERSGQYFVDLDSETKLKVETDLIRMHHSCCDGEPQCTFTADLSVFENNEGRVYCHMQDSNGKIFIVEGNSNCYILDDQQQVRTKEFQPENFAKTGRRESDVSEFVASADLQVCPSMETQKNNKLLRENKYFALRRDMTGIEILHSDDVARALTRKQKGSLVFTQKMPDTENRCFVLVVPGPKEKNKKWGVKSILPNPKYEPGMSKKTSSSTYGVPPSWMHPFPKRKFKFAVPEPLTCRVFIETKRTDLSPSVGTLDFHYCEMKEVTEAKHSIVPPGGTEEYLKRLSNDDQDLLKEIYALAAASLINEKKKLRRTNSEKLERYLELSRHYVAMREYHARCIRYHIIPNYFHHPAGMSWLILDEFLLHKLRQCDEETHRQTLMQRIAESDKSESMSGFSNEEVEYNMSPRPEQSFSSMSYRSQLSAQTAPSILRTGGICKCKVSGATNYASCPVLRGYWNDASSESNIEEAKGGICEFRENDIEMLGKKGSGKETPLMSLEDLMQLGLI